MRLKRDGKPVHWSDEAPHRNAYAADPTLYALCACLQKIQPWQQARILFLLLAETRRHLDASTRIVLERITLFLLATLPTEVILTVFLSVRRSRANHRHTVQSILSYLLQHPDLFALIRTRNPAVRDCLEHVLGKTRARQFYDFGPRRGESIKPPALLKRYGGSDERLRKIAAALQIPSRSAAELPVPQPEFGLPIVPPAAFDSGLIQTLLRLYREGTSPLLVEALEEAIALCGSALPSLSIPIAFILDASASMRGHSPNEYLPIALAVALERVLQARCSQLRTYTVGGFGWPPAPEGASDLASALLNALEAVPDLVLLVTDGGENTNAGEVERILATRVKFGQQVPVVRCLVATTEEFVSETGPFDLCVTLPLRQEADFAEIIQRCALMLSPSGAWTRLREELELRLEQWEREVYGWTVAC